MSTSVVTLIRPSGTERLLEDPTEARKALESIDIRLTNRPITLLQHKIYNVWVAYAQSTQDAESVRIFEFPLSEVMEVCGFDSNNHAYFIESARELLNLRVEYNSLGRYSHDVDAQAPTGGAKRGRKGRAASAAPAAVKWAAAQLVSFIEVDSAANLMRIEFPEVLRKEILRPETYRVIDLSRQRLFTSRAGLALYEYVLKHASDKVTPWLRWETYSMMLSGSVQPHKTFREFSKMLNRAIEQVNAHHESHQVLPEFTKRGRAIENMRLQILLRHEAIGQGTQAPSAEVVNALTALGLSSRDATQLAKSHPDHYLMAQVAYVRRRQSDTSKGSLKAPVAYLRAAIAGNYAGLSAPALPPPATAMDERASTVVVSFPAAQVPREPVPAKQDKARPAPSSLEADRTWYAKLPEAQRAELAAEFMQDASPMVRQALKSKGLESTVAASAFFGWLRRTGAAQRG